MPKWLFYSFLAVVLWAVWAIIPKATSDKMSPALMQVILTMGLVPVASTLAFSKNLTEGNRIRRGIVYAFATGLCGCIGNVALLEALKHGGEASTIYPLTGMYPLVTVILARFLLKENPNRVQSLGIGIALFSIYLFSTEGSSGAAVDTRSWMNAISVWMAFALLALILYGVAGVTQKVATNEISTELSTICFAAAFIPVACAILLTQRLDYHVSNKDWFLAILFGMLMGFAMVVQFAAYRRGKASVVTAVTALYPAVTVVLAVPLFGERLDSRKIVAIILALAAGAAVSYERQPEVESTTRTGAHSV
jgi:transporter family protein